MTKLPLYYAPALLIVSMLLLRPAEATAQDAPRILALVVTTAADTTGADSVAASLEDLDAEILRVRAPTNAGLRSVMRRFAEEAELSDAAFVFLDMPVADFQKRIFVLPEDDALDRATDLFTRSIPLRAFARMTALAERGGAVIVSSNLPAAELPSDVTPALQAPDPAPGASEILLLDGATAGPAVELLTTMLADPDRVDLGQILVALAQEDGAALSAPPRGSIILRAPAVVAEVPALDIVEDTETVQEVDTQAPASLEELTEMEKSFAPAVKRRVQQALHGLNHYDGLIDGKFGNQTRTGINAFQSDRSEEKTGFLTSDQLRDLLDQP